MKHVKGFAQGVAMIGRGFGFLKDNKKLWPYAILPTIINFFLLGFTFFLIIHYFPGFFEWILAKISFFNASYRGFWGKLLVPVIWLIKLLFFMIVMIIGLILCFVTGMVVSGPFNDILSEKTEKIINPGQKVPQLSFFSSIARTIIVELQKAAVFILIPVFLLVLNLIPGIGTLIYLILINLFAIFDIGFAFVDYPMSRRCWKFSDRFRFARRHKFAVSGLGIIALVPFLPFFINAPMVVGGTILFTEIAKDA